MSALPNSKAAPGNDESQCLTRSVLSALKEDPTLEAVTIDRGRKTISVATLGKTDIPKVAERIRDTFQRAQASRAQRRCELLAGDGQCDNCNQPLSELQRQKITIQHQGEKTTIARVTCPTAPTFWRWRDIPWPKVVQRDVEFLEHAEEIDEWKAQLAAAVFCGLCGLGAFYFRSHPWSLAGFLLAYLAGSWFTVQEVWERLQKRAIDVHFLMLAVAAGSASTTRRRCRRSSSGRSRSSPRTR